MNLKIEKYIKQIERWPKDGKHIMAQFDDEKVVVYQAYRPSIGKFAAEKKYFGGEFSFSRMSWIKPNFLWMMYRSGWASKPGQEIVLAISLKRAFFEKLLECAFPSSNISNLAKAEWDKKIAGTNVRLQWDPDHDPHGTKQERRAIQLGLRGEFLGAFKGDAIVDIEDITPFVKEQFLWVESSNFDELLIPEEHVFPVTQKASNNLEMENPI